MQSESHKNTVLDWLLEGPAWVQYRALVDMGHEPESASRVRAARAAMLADSQVAGLIAELQGWPGVVLNSHKSAGQLYHKLKFLGDLGVCAGDPGMGHVVELAMAHQSTEGPFTLPLQVSAAHGGSGEKTWAWALCDAPVTTGALCRLGLAEDPRVQRSVDHIASLARDNGWPCAVSAELKGWRGPGRKEDPCPYATLAACEMELEAGLPHEAAVRAGTASLLEIWERRRQDHPYMFYMGTDFCKLKSPAIWYDILHVADVLSRCSWLKGDRRLLDMVGTVAAKLDAEGCATPESVWTAWKEWEFGQKKVPSRWVTLIAQRVMQRIGE